MYNTINMGGGGNFNMDYSCESFLDYSYGDVVMEAFHPIQAIKERLRKICAWFYGKCDKAYNHLKNTNPSIASIFKHFRDLFGSHSKHVEKADDKSTMNIEAEKIKHDGEVLKSKLDDLIKESEDALKDVNDIRMKTASSIEERHKRAADEISKMLKNVFGEENNSGRTTENSKPLDDIINSLNI